MPIKFSKEEQFLINELSKNPNEIEDSTGVAELLVKNIGNTNLSDRLYEQEHSQQWLPVNEEKGRLILERWAYKTPTAQEIKSIANKIKIARQLHEQEIELLPEEKISLLELKAISRFSLLLGKKDSFRDEESEQAKDLFKGTLEKIYKNSTNQEFKELYENMVVCEELAANLRRDIFKSHTYNAHDILIRNEAKSAVIENVAQEGITPLQKQQDTRIIFFDMFDELDKDYPGRVKSTPKSSNKADISTINVTDILSSDIYRLPNDKLNQTLINQIQQEKDPKKLEALLIKNGAEKVPNSIAEEFVRTEDVKKSKTFNNIEDNLANTLEILAKSAKDQDEFVMSATPRIEAYLAVSNLQVSKKPDLTQNLGNYTQYPAITTNKSEYLAQKNEITKELKNLYLDRNKTGLKAEIIKFISSTLVTLGLKKSTTEKTIKSISGKFTDKLLQSREHGKDNNKIEH